MFLNWGECKQKYYMLERIACFFRGRRDQTWPAHPVQQILAEEHNLLTVEFYSAWHHIEQLLLMKRSLVDQKIHKNQDADIFQEQFNVLKITCRGY